MTPSGHRSRTDRAGSARGPRSPAPAATRPPAGRRAPPPCARESRAREAHARAPGARGHDERRVWIPRCPSQLRTFTVMLVLMTLPEASRTLPLSVWLPLGLVLVFHGMVTGPRLGVV